MIMELWIARARDGELQLFGEKPTRVEEWGCFILHKNPYSNITETSSMNPRWFPEVTWKNSPRKVEIKLKEK